MIATKRLLSSLVAVLAACGPAAAQEAPEEQTALYAPSVWDVHVGDHFSELPADEFINFACGTNGGPPALPLTGFDQFASCRPEEGNGLHEVYFEYDNELELFFKAQSMETQAAVYENTSIYAIPVIASALFDDDGFVREVRLVTDTRVSVEQRELAVTLGGFLTARFGVEGWTCEDLPQLEGEQPYNGRYEKRHCERTDDEGNHVVMETHIYRRPGQEPLTPEGRESVGQFWSATTLEITLVGDVPDRDARLAAINAVVDPGPSERDQLIARAMDCPGCDFTGANFKRANLTGANLAGANLTDANLHEAILRDADLEGAILDEANLNAADMRRANLSGASIHHALMYQTLFDGADLSHADLADSLAKFVSLARTNLSEARMVSMDLRNSRINDADMRLVDLRLSWLHDSQMIRSDLSGARVSDTVMQRVNLSQTNLTAADFTGADLIQANMRDANADGADFSYARLTLAVTAGMTFVGANFENAALPSGFHAPPQ